MGRSEVDRNWHPISNVYTVLVIIYDYSKNHAIMSSKCMSFFGLEIGEGGFKQERRDFFPSKIQDDSTLIIFILLMAFTG